ncbi:ZIP family metal transporter [Candidatus Nomurabacteria bacterium]|nr:ZIP family metal transporter [Candidatus Kaiserbacteria bacterium]MCB9814915.1 ZIP family metal transporter [Candidatus Nomurabacteria bacterium]
MLILQALGVAGLVALVSVVGVFFFGQDKRLIGIERYAIPVAVGVFLSLILFELIPETVSASAEWGGIVVAIGFIAFYILAHKLHTKYHHLEAEGCDQKGAATLILVGDGIHNIADGVILGAAFLADPAIGIATAVGLALHEIPQEIVEFGILLRAGYTRKRAVVLNLLSACGIFIGTFLVMFLAQYVIDYVWILTSFAAGNLLFLAASDLLPRIHGNLSHYGSIWNSTIAIVIGFVLMTSVLSWSHRHYGHDATLPADMVVVDWSLGSG